MPRPACALVALLFSASLYAGRIDFEELPPLVLPLDQAVIDTAGFRFQMINGGSLSVVPLTAFCPFGCVTNGTAALAVFNGSWLEITAISSFWFSLEGLDFAGTFEKSSANVQTLRVEGDFGAGGTITADLVTPNPDRFASYAVSGFTGLRALRLIPLQAVDPACQSCPEFQIDNVSLALLPSPAQPSSPAQPPSAPQQPPQQPVVPPPASAALPDPSLIGVPEPRTILFALTGLLCVAGRWMGHRLGGRGGRFPVSR